MAGNDKDLKIGITADTSGAEQAVDAIDKVVDATEATADANKKAGEEAAKAAENLAEYHKYLEDHEKRQAEYAAKRLELEKGVTEEVTKRPQPTATPTPEGRGFGGMLDSSPEPIREVTKAIEEQVEALAELSDEEAGVIDATKRLNDEARKPDGFKTLFDQQRLIEIGKELGNLGRVVGDFAREFAKTEEGKRLLEGLSEETKVYGATALNVAGSVAQGFATGGPIGGALAGISALVQQFAGEYLDAQARIEASNKEAAAAEAEHIQRMQEKAKAAQNKALQDQIEAETDRLKDQNEVLAENERLLKSRKDAADAAFELRQAQDAAAGASPEQLEIQRIQRELQQKEAELTQERRRLQEETNLKERAANNADIDTRNIGRVNGTDSPEAREARERARRLREEFEDAARSDRGRFEEIDNQRQAARNRAAAGLTRIASGSREDAERDSERRRQEREREAERQEREEDQRDAQRAGIGRRGEGLANQAARAVAGASERAARNLENLGNSVANDPTAAGLESLASSIGQAADELGRQDASKSRALRQVQQEVERLKAQIKKLQDGR